MAQALYHFLQHSFLQYSRVRRLATFQVLGFQVLGIVVLGLSCLGCWQEVRYEPDPSGLRAQKVDAAEAEPDTVVQEPAIGIDEPPFPIRPPVEEENTTPEKPAILPPEEEPAESLDPFGEEVEREIEQETVGAEVEEVGDLGVEVGVGVGVRYPPAEASSPGGAGRTGLAVWRMCSQWSMAAALQAKGRDVESYGERLEQAKYGAKLLGVSLPDLPIHEADADRLTENLAYLLEEAGPGLANELKELHGANHAALAELAIKTHVLLLSYTPSSSQLEPVVSAVRQAAEGSGLPKGVWREVVDSLTARAEFKQVKAAIFQLHKRTTAHLSGAKEWAVGSGQ